MKASEARKKADAYNTCNQFKNQILAKINAAAEKGKYQLSLKPDEIQTCVISLLINDGYKVVNDSEESEMVRGTYTKITEYKIYW